MAYGISFFSTCLRDFIIPFMSTLTPIFTAKAHPYSRRPIADGVLIDPQCSSDGARGLASRNPIGELVGPLVPLTGSASFRHGG